MSECLVNEWMSECNNIVKSRYFVHSVSTLVLYQCGTSTPNSVD